MQTTAKIGFLTALFLGLALPWADGGEPNQKPGTQKLPFRCFTEAWDGLYQVGNPAYDRAKEQLTWTLAAKDEVTVGRYEAFLTDPDAVEVATVPVKMDPSRGRFKAKTRVQATLSLKDIDVENVSKVIIRERRD